MSVVDTCPPFALYHSLPLTQTPHAMSFRKQWQPLKRYQHQEMNLLVTICTLHMVLFDLADKLSHCNNINNHQNNNNGAGSRRGKEIRTSEREESNKVQELYLSFYLAKRMRNPNLLF